MLKHNQTVQQIIPAPPGYALIWYYKPAEGRPNGDYISSPIIAWALIEEVSPSFEYVDRIDRDQTIEPVTVEEIGWPDVDQPVAMRAPNGSVHTAGGDSYETISAWLSSNARALKPA